MELPPSLQAELDQLLSLPSLTYKQKKRAQKLLSYQASLMQGGNSLEPPPSYIASKTYPSKSTRTRRADTFFRSKEEQTRVMSRSINNEIDYEWIARNNYEIQKKFPKGALETSSHYYKRLVREIQSRKQNLDLLNKPVEYDPDPTKGFFAKRTLDPSSPTFISLDIETDDYKRPISIAAVKLQWNGRTKKFESIDNYQRFYLAHNKDLVGTFETHGLTAVGLLNLRDQQGLKYSTHYNSKEQADLRAYIGNSIVIGHNIVDFDLPTLFPGNPLTNSTIDTLKASRSAWKGKKNDLEHAIYRVFGKTMEELGFSHHKAGADATAEAMLLAAMAADPGVVGQSIRYVMGAKDPRHIAEYNYMMHSMVTTGTYQTMYRSNDLHEVFMDERVTGLRDAEGNYIEDPNLWGGSIFSDPIGIEESVTSEGAMEIINELAKHVHKLEAEGNPSLHGKYGKMTSTQIANAEDDLFTAFNKFNHYKSASIIKEIAKARSNEAISHIGRMYGYSVQDEGWASLVSLGAQHRALKEKEQKEDYYHQLEKYRDKDVITSKQFDKLTGLTGSYEDLVDATNDVIEANERLKKVYQSIAEIKPYDMNDLVGAVHGQWSGIKGAAHGVIPSFVRVPLSRLGDAALNAIDRSMSPWNAFQRIYNNTAGKVLRGVYGTSNIGGVAAATGHAGWGTGIGLFRAGEQIAGNVAQAGIEMKGLSIQNSLNTLGAMISWVATPFQLLHKAAKLLIGSFTGLSLKLNSFMGSGIGMMSQMGNPLTALTGMDYGAYIRSTLKDSASLLRRGSMNSTIENFAQQQQMFYALGQVDTNRLIASSLLGVYGDVYNPTVDAEGAYNSMANKILMGLKGASPAQRSKMMALASTIDANLPQLLQSAELMGIPDVSVLDNPNKLINRANGRQQGGIFYNPLQQWEASNFRWTQWEYGAAKEQMGFSKMRIADRMWTAGGKGIYNAANRLFDGVAEAINTGDWSRVVKEATYIWNTARDAFSNAWEGIKKAVKGEEGENGEGNSIVNTLKGVGLLIENIVIKGALKILNVWDNLMVQLADRLQGAIAYLSTVQVKPYIEDGKLKFNISTIKDRMEYSDADKLYSENSALGGVGAMVLDEPNEGMKGLIALGEAMGIKGHGGSALNPAYNPTIGEIKDKLRSLREQGYQYIPYEYLKASGTPIEQIGLDDESIDAFIRNLKGTEGASTSWEKAAVAFATPSREGMVYNKKAAYDKTGIGGFARQWVGDVEDVVGTLASAAVNDNYARVDLWFKNDTGKKAMIGADSKGSVFSKDIVLLQQMVPDGLKLVVDQIK